MFAEAHSLKGAAGTLRLERLTAISGDLASSFGGERTGVATIDLDAVGAAGRELAAAAAEPFDVPAAEPAAGAGGGVTILHVEDDDVTAAVVERSLTRQPGVTLLRAREGASALELARERHPDVVLLDLHLPDIAGGEVADRLRADPATARLAVVITSGGGDPEEVDRLLAAGARAYLQKPLELAQLRDVVASLAR